MTDRPITPIRKQTPAEPRPRRRPARAAQADRDRPGPAELPAWPLQDRPGRGAQEARRAGAGPARSPRPATAKDSRRRRRGARPRRRVRRGLVLQGLTAEERAHRTRALKGAIRADEEARRQAQIDAEQQRAEAERLRRGGDRAAPRTRPAARPRRRRATSTTRNRAASRTTRGARPRRRTEDSRREVAERAGKAAAAKVAALTAAGKVKAVEEEPEEEAPAKRGPRVEVKKAPTPVRRDEPRRRTGKLTITKVLNEDERRAPAQPRLVAPPPRARKAARAAAASGTDQDRARRGGARAHHRAGARQPHGRAQRRRHQGADAHGRDGHHQPDASTPTPPSSWSSEFGHRIRRVSEADVEIGLKGDDDVGRDAGAAAAGRHRDGPCRSRQDLAARCAAPHRRGGRRGRRHHAAYRRLSGHAQRRPAHHLHRHAGPPGLHRDARARRPRHRYRRAGGRRR